jgi:tRNA(fMet)-specific endonuclease VapC
MVLLDTDICSYIIKGHPKIVAKFSKLEKDKVAISAMTASELAYGAARAGGERYKQAVRVFRHYVRVLSWPVLAIDHYATIRTQLETRGSPIGEMDVLIAAHAMAIGAPLVTNNTKHFSRIAGLELENWKAE